MINPWFLINLYFQVNSQNTTELKFTAGTSMQQPPPLQLQPQQIIVTTAHQPMIVQHQPSIQSNAVPVTIQQQIVTSCQPQPTPISTPPVQQPEVSSSTVNQPIQQQKPADEAQNKPEEQSSSSANQSTASKSFSIQIPVPPNAQGGAPQHTVKVIPAMDPNKVVDEEVDPSWPFVCDWRGCPK